MNQQGYLKMGGQTQGQQGLYIALGACSKYYFPRLCVTCMRQPLFSNSREGIFAMES